MNNLTPSDLDKLDRLQIQFTRLIVGEAFSANLEVFLRTEFVEWIGNTTDEYNTMQIPTPCTGAVIAN
jgi:hypothetical protein